MEWRPEIVYVVEVLRPCVRQRLWRFGALEVGGTKIGDLIAGRTEHEVERRARAAWHHQVKRGATGRPTLLLMEYREPVTEGRVEDFHPLHCLNCGRTVGEVSPALSRIHLTGLGGRLHDGSITCDGCKEETEWQPPLLKLGSRVRCRIRRR
jgi:hypothetical protein